MRAFRALRIAPEEAAREQADVFLREMVRDTGVSATFAEAARPTMEKAFLAVDDSRRGALLDQLRELFHMQASTERSCSRALEAVGRIEMSHQAMHENLSSAQRQMTDLNTRLVGTAFAALRLLDSGHTRATA